jgi:hypothetical protein
MCKTVTTDPIDGDEYGLKYPNNTQKKRTIFIDLDDTLIHVSLYKLGENAIPVQI